MKNPVLAVASGGGHFEQLIRIAEHIDSSRIIYATTVNGYTINSELPPIIVNDCNTNTKFSMLVTCIQLTKIIIQFNPSIIISTGAAPGLIAIIMGKIFFKKTIWIDSIANSEDISKSGKIAKYFVDLYLTQWKHLENKSHGPRYGGSIL